jgi:hypothetical protein
MADISTLYNSLIDTLLAISSVAELEQGQVWRDFNHAIRTNLPAKADDLTGGSTSKERVESSSAYALALQSSRIAREALDRVNEPELLPIDVAYGKTIAEHKKGNVLTLTPCKPDGTPLVGYSNISVYATFPPANSPVGFDIATGSVLAYMPIPSLDGKIGILFPADANRLLVDSTDDTPRQYLTEKIIADESWIKKTISVVLTERKLKLSHSTPGTAYVDLLNMVSISAYGAAVLRTDTLKFDAARHFDEVTNGSTTQTWYFVPAGNAVDDILVWDGVKWISEAPPVIPDVPDIPDPPGSGDYVLTSQDGTISWVAMSTFTCP